MAGSSVRQSAAISSNPVKRAGRRTIFVADAHRDDGRRFIVRADEKLTAFVELEKSDSRIRGGSKLVNHFVVAVYSGEQAESAA